MFIMVMSETMEESEEAWRLPLAGCSLIRFVLQEVDRPCNAESSRMQLIIAPWIASDKKIPQELS